MSGPIPTERTFASRVSPPARVSSLGSGIARLALSRTTRAVVPASAGSVTCTIASGQTKGSTTGLRVAFSAGDLLDVAIPTNNGGNAPASFAVTVGP